MPRQPVHAPDLIEAPIATKGFVAAITGQCHCYLATGELRHAEGRDHRVVGQWLAQMVDQAWHQGGGIGTHHHFVVVGADMACDLGGMRQLVEAFILEADGKGLQRCCTQACHGRHRDAGVDATGEEGTQGHIGYQSQTGGFQHFFAYRLAGLVEVQGAAPFAVDLPVAEQPLDPAILDRHGMRRWQLANGGKAAHRRRDVLQRQVVVDGLKIGCARQARIKREQ